MMRISHMWPGRWVRLACVGVAMIAALSLHAADPAPQSGANADAAPLSRAEARQRAEAIIVEAASSQHPMLRANAVEVVRMLPGHARAVVQQAMRDENEAVRYAAAVTAGRADMKYVAPSLRKLLDDDRASVRAAALYALHRIGEDVDITPLAGMLMGPDPRLRAHVATILGLIGDDSAIPLLQRAAETPLPKKVGAGEEAVVRTQLAEAMAKLGDEGALEALRSGAFSPFGEVRVLSITAMGAVGDRRMAAALRQFLDGPPVELQLAAASSLARLGEPRGRAVVIARTADPDPVVRSQATWALGWFDDEATWGKLTTMMSDKHPQVRVHAAASVLRRTGSDAPGD